MTLGPTRQTLAARLLADYRRHGSLPSITGGDHDPEPDPDPTPDPDPDPEPDPDDKKKVSFTSEQSDWISRKIAHEVKKDREKREEADRKAKEKADEDRKRKEAEDRGEFETVKQGLESTIKERDQELERVNGELGILRTEFDTRYANALKELPAVITAFAPAEDASVKDKTAWLTKAQEQAKALDKTRHPGNGGGDPKPKNGDVEIPSPVPVQNMF